ncbi:hypothetical protein INT45_012261 [Circinella minor]|uniref:Cytochrome P450 n=1 Tax=Circinella minor TaxID=1195481 RepID=A0A8H7S3F0_9FUNG|nr:hypothetical protein INT45_012261 [Circinella minor]
MSQLSVTSFYNNSKIVQRLILWIRENAINSKSTAITSGAALAVTLLVLTKLWRRRSDKDTPTPFIGIPTPKGCRPIVGHLLTIGPDRIQKFHEWHKEFGPIFHIKLGVNNTLVVADPYITHDLLVTNGKHTSNRPAGIFMHDFGSGGLGGIASLQSNDDMWRTVRRIIDNSLDPHKIRNEFSPVLHKEAEEYVDLVATGENIDPLPHLLRVSLNFTLIITFGVRTTSIDDPVYKKAIYCITKNMSFSDFKHVGGMFIPTLKLFDPILGVRKDVNDHMEKHCIPFYLEQVEKALSNDGYNLTKVLNDELNEGKKTGPYHILLPTINDVVVAGTDTTAVTITWAFLQISTMPEVQKKIQGEIDIFVKKNGRVPYFWERGETPYMIAVQRECFRMRPTTEFGISHAASQDFEWNGNYIPEGTWIMPNNMEAHLNPAKYPEPEKFIPERFLENYETMTASANGGAKERDQFNFGWGRYVDTKIK